MPVFHSHPDGSASLFEGLNISDARVRKRIRGLLELTSVSREFSQAEVHKYVGKITNKNSRILRRLFVRLPYFPSRTLGEVEMYGVQADARSELTRLMEQFE